MAPGLKRTKKGRLWAHVRDERPWGSAIPPAAFYKYSPDRKGEHPQTHLKDYEGFVHVDGFAGYDKLFAQGKAREVGCMAHIRRKFAHIYDATCSPIAEKALKWIAGLYHIERDITNTGSVRCKNLGRTSLTQSRKKQRTPARIAKQKSENRIPLFRPALPAAGRSLRPARDGKTAKRATLRRKML